MCFKLFPLYSFVSTKVGKTKNWALKWEGDKIRKLRTNYFTIKQRVIGIDLRGNQCMNKNFLKLSVA